RCVRAARIAGREVAQSSEPCTAQKLPNETELRAARNRRGTHELAERAVAKPQRRIITRLDERHEPQLREDAGNLLDTRAPLQVPDARERRRPAGVDVCVEERLQRGFVPGRLQMLGERVQDLSLPPRKQRVR